MSNEPRTAHFGIEAPAEASGVLLIFAHARTKFVSVRAQGEGLEAETDDLDGRIALFQGGAVPAGARLELTVVYEGAPPVLVRTLWIVAPDDLPDRANSDWMFLGPLVQRYDGGGPVQPVVELISEPDVQAYAARVRLTPREASALREREIDAMARTQRFFYRLEAATDEGLIPADDFRRHSNLDYHLQYRLLERALLGRVRRDAAGNVLDAGHVPAFKDAPSGEERKTLSELSGLFVQLANDELLCDGHDDLDWAFEEFVVDRVAVHYRDLHRIPSLQLEGTPDGSNLFKFAELGFAAHARGFDTVFWSRHLGSLVRAAHLFVEHAGVRIHGALRLGNDKVFQFRPHRPFDWRRADELRRLHASSSGVDHWEEAFGSILSQALADTRGAPVEGKVRPIRTEVDLRW